MLNVITKTLTKLFGSKEERDIKQLIPLVAEINRFESAMQALTDEELKGKTESFKTKIREAVATAETEIQEIKATLNLPDKDVSIDERRRLSERLDVLDKEWHEALEACLTSIQTEAFAVLKETCRRHVGKSWMVAGEEVVWNMVPYDVQLMGALAMQQGNIAEMKTGEGKTLVAIFPAYLNALVGRGVHVITVNTYLSKRDAEWNAPIFAFHGLTVDCIDNHEPNSESRRGAYRCDITYGTNNEFGFDYLRDNMVGTADQLVQREHHYAIIDEVDSILIDEARTPLIISGPVPQDTGTQKFVEMRPRVASLVDAQKKLVAGFIAEYNAKHTAGDDEGAGLALFRAFRGFPKNRQLMKLQQDPQVQKLLNKTEMFYLQDNAKNLIHVDKELLYSVDMKQNSLEMTEKGLEFITKANEDKEFFVIPDMGEETALIEAKMEALKSEKLAEVSTDEDKAKVEQEISQERSRLMNEINLLFAERGDRIHTVNQLLKAYTLFEKEEEYIVQDDKVMIVDEHTGRVLSGRRYSDGLHQAIEAKENVKVEAATQTYATITLQNYFRMYHKLAGMTGTAVTEEGEFNEIYKLDVVVIPTNRPIQRDDQEDLIFRSKREKYNAVIQKIQEYYEKGQPVLVGTTSVESSETIGRLLTRSKIPHNILNAKQHARESEIVKAAGQLKAVTVATNMAGRGTDIKLSEEAKAKGGLAILGTERHESRRIDLQLRGRSGRQGDPGESVFYVSLEDDLMRLFGGSDRITGLMDRMKFDDGEVLQHPWLTKSLERAQKKVEQNNFSIRKRQLEYDDVLNNQRKVIYARRKHALMGDQLRTDIYNMLDEFIDNMVTEFADNGDLKGLKQACMRRLGFEPDFDTEGLAAEQHDLLVDYLFDKSIEVYQNKEKAVSEPLYRILQQLAADDSRPLPSLIQVLFSDGAHRMRIIVDVPKALETNGTELVRALERTAILGVIDDKWMEHLRELDSVKEGIGLRAFGQKNPLLEYKREAFDMFKQLLDDINEESISIIWKAIPEMSQQPAQASAPRKSKIDLAKAKASQAASEGLGMHDPQSATAVANQVANQTRTQQEKITPVKVEKTYGRNDLVTIKNLATGETKEMKWKKAEGFVESNQWMVV